MGTNLTSFSALIAIILCTVHFSEASWSCWAPPLVFGANCEGNVVVFGYAGYQRGYRVSIIGNTQVCCEAKGFDANTRQTWYSIGCGYSSFSGTVPWGNVASTEGIRCRGTPFGSQLLIN